MQGGTTEIPGTQEHKKASRQGRENRIESGETWPWAVFLRRTLPFTDSLWEELPQGCTAFALGSGQLGISSIMG